MEATPINNIPESPKRDRGLMKIIIAVLVTALVVGGGVYLWQQTNQNKNSTNQQVNTNTEKTNSAINTNGTNVTHTMTFSVFFGNTKKNSNQQNCTAVYPVTRVVPAPEEKTTTIFAETALKQLFAGPTTEEQAVDQGYSSIFSEDSANILKEVIIKDYIAYVDLVDIRNIMPNANTSCGSQEFFASATTTLMQFTGVQKVIYAINENPQTFYEWMQLGCTADNNHCDSSVFEADHNTDAQATVDMYLVALEDNGKSGEKIGCGDSVVSVETITSSATPTITAALEALLSLKEQTYGKSGLYNALYQSDLTVDRVAIEGDKAIVHLSGEFVQGGACDSPRVQAQLENTILQFEDVKTTEIFINDESLVDALSSK